MPAAINREILEDDVAAELERDRLVADTGGKRSASVGVTEFGACRGKGGGKDRIGRDFRLGGGTGCPASARPAWISAATQPFAIDSSRAHDRNIFEVFSPDK